MHELERRLITQQHKDLFLQTKHTLDAIDELIEKHRKLVSMQATAGVSPVGIVEKVFHETLLQVKKEIIHTLEITLDDLEHRGDKNHKKHFPDGVE
ncbi:hypothetical protein [Bacillus sp. EAC]|uniref:hypothetical protein n=1 Tax=Bacillus sp. EAC TaxID=1978338 RepID=UPI000B4530F0|nr:hypothetical protein [Bacillus sp. EAC]